MIKNPTTGELVILPDGRTTTIQQVQRERPDKPGKGRVMVVTGQGSFMAWDLRRPGVRPGR